MGNVTATPLSLVKIKIPNWTKFNPRKDRANYTWFRLENGFFSDQQVFGLSAEQQRLFIFLLCELSKQNRDEVSLNPEYVAAVLRSTPSEILHELNVLSEFKLIDVIMPADSRHDDGSLPANSLATNVRTYERDETYDTRRLPRDFVRGAAPADGGSVETEKRDPPPKPSGTEVWKAYEEAYTLRYRAPPVRNAKTNALCLQLVKRLGESPAPEVARFFVSHGGARYVGAGHPLSLLVLDAEKLHTEWKTGHLITRADVNRSDLRQGNVQAMKEYLGRENG